VESDSEGRKRLSAAIGATPGLSPEAAELAGDRALSDDEFYRRLEPLAAQDAAFARLLDEELGSGGAREVPVGFGSSKVPAIWWRCPEPGCARPQQGGNVLGPFRFPDCPDHAVPLVRA